MVLDPRIRRPAAVLLLGGSGFLLSGAGPGEYPQPLAMGLICAATGWRALVMSLGAMMGYPAFWGNSGNQGMVWAAAGGLLALLLGKREEAKAQPLMIPSIAAFLTAVTDLTFRLMLGQSLPVVLSCVRVALTFLSGVLFTQAVRCRDVFTDWLVLGVGVLALARVRLGPFGLGFTAAGLLSVYGAFPAAALAGLALDLTRITPLPMTGVLCLAYFLRLIPFDRRWQHYAAPGAACLAVMAVWRQWDITPLPGLILGGAVAAVLPPRPQIPRRRGETGAAQVRLEMGAEVMRTLGSMVAEMETPGVDAEILVGKVRDRACGSCSARNSCTQKDTLSSHHLLAPLDADCRKQGRLLPELKTAREQLGCLQADRQRRREYRMALVQQYRILGDYLRDLADRLPRRGEGTTPRFRVEASARSRGKEQANGDRCLAFPCSDCRYFVLLCDGMGTGLGAAREGQTAAALIRNMLTAGFPATYALATVNGLLALRGMAGGVTVDLAELQLDTGHAILYKWGAAPSWVLTRGKAEKIGTATPPPGITLEGARETEEKLSLRRGEVLILLSDGLEAGEGLRLGELAPDRPPGELAAEILKRERGDGEDDATAAVIRLVPLSMDS